MQRGHSGYKNLEKVQENWTNSLALFQIDGAGLEGVGQADGIRTGGFHGLAHLRDVLACATYDGFLFPPMEALLTHLKTKNFQNRTVGLMENGTWAPMAAKLMRAELDGMKNMTVCDTVVTIRSAVNAAAEAQMDALADEIVRK